MVKVPAIALILIEFIATKIMIRSTSLQLGVFLYLLTITFLILFVLMYQYFFAMALMVREIFSLKEMVTIKNFLQRMHHTTVPELTTPEPSRQYRWSDTGIWIPIMKALPTPFFCFSAPK